MRGSGIQGEALGKRSLDRIRQRVVVQGIALPGYAEDALEAVLPRLWNTSSLRRVMVSGRTVMEPAKLAVTLLMPHHLPPNPGLQVDRVAERLIAREAAAADPERFAAAFELVRTLTVMLD